MYLVREFNGSKMLCEHRFDTREEVVVFFGLLVDFLRNEGVEWRTERMTAGGFTVEFKRQPSDTTRPSKVVNYRYEFWI